MIELHPQQQASVYSQSTVYVASVLVENEKKGHQSAISM